jgi:hypothetical protein
VAARGMNVRDLACHAPSQPARIESIDARFALERESSAPNVVSRSFKSSG